MKKIWDKKSMLNFSRQAYERVDEFIDKSKVTSNKLQVVDNCIHQRNYLRSHLVQGLTPQLNGIASVEQNGDYMYIQ